MPDEKNENIQHEKTPLITPRETSQESKQQEKPPEIKKLDFAEAAIKNAGDQGISLNPVGSHTTNPFMAQDTVQPQPSVQMVTPTPPSVEAVIPPAPAQSSEGGSNAGE
ncbi:MAG: hypothetical protein HZB50_14195 [Chloroflexi bacterium]|nr:hypothetical protein [Chloroflexota bacterium]